MTQHPPERSSRRRHGRATRPRRRGLVALALLALVAASCSSSKSDDQQGQAATTTAAAATTTTRPEPFKQTIVPLPAGVKSARYPVWSADGAALVFSAIPAKGDTVEIFRMAPDGSGLACLSCGVPRTNKNPYLKPLAFSDGKRVLVRLGEQSPVTNANHAVLECTPNVANCTTAALVPIEVPGIGDAALKQPQREFRIAPDAKTVGFTQVRTDKAGAERFVPTVGTLRRDGARYVIDNPRAVSNLGELKNFTPDGTAVLISAFTTLADRAADPDVVRIDLATGKISDVTDNGDYDEDLAYAPDMASYAVFSGRGSGLFATVSQLRRPNDIGPGLDCLFGYLFASRRKELLEPWLVPAGAEQKGQLGELLNPGALAEGWDARTLVTWHPDGDRLLFWEAKGDPFGAPTAGSTRFVIIDLPDRKPSPAKPVGPSPTPTWAPALVGLVPPALPFADSRAGKAAGKVTVTHSEGTKPGSGTISVNYDGFSDDGKWIIDGTESSTYQGGLLGGCRYTAHLTASGDHHGTLTAAATLAPRGMTGTITSNVDGRKLTLP